MLEFICDICGARNNPADTYGEGVYAGLNHEFDFTISRTDILPDAEPLTIGLKVRPFAADTTQHICAACIGRMVKELSKRWPDEPQFATSDHTHATHTVLADGIWYEHDGSKELCPICPMLTDKEDDAQDTERGEDTDSDLHEVHSEQWVQGSGAGKPAYCPGCGYDLGSESPGQVICPRCSWDLRSPGGGPG